MPMTVSTENATVEPAVLSVKTPAGKPYSGRPNPLSAAYEKKTAELDERLAKAKEHLVSVHYN